jgi:hypothetical protein
LRVVIIIFALSFFVFELVLWESQIDATVAWIKPTTSYRFAAGKEVNAFFSVRFGIAKE